MQCNAVSLRDFRNIEQAEVRFCPGVNVLYGNNAQGKTNLLEAVYFAAIGKSFRSLHAKECIAFGKEAAAISLDFEGAGRVQNITMHLFLNRLRAVEKNHVRVGKMSELVGAFRAVLFCPEQLSLIKGGPAERRQFLDIAISALEPAYLAGLQRYAHILKQRNALIRAAEKDRAGFNATVEVWSRQLAHEGAYLARSRMRYVQKAIPHVASCFTEMTNEREHPTLVYLGCDKEEGATYEDISHVEALLYQKLTSNYEKEIAAGATLYGVHKDDIDVMLNGRSARSFASQGQQRSLALALKLAEGELCREDCGEYPVFLLDDVLSELDGSRRDYLLHKIAGRQVIMTTCEAVNDRVDRMIRVENGRFLQA
jgi:DNA replication and repair protein RecF